MTETIETPATSVAPRLKTRYQDEIKDALLQLTCGRSLPSIPSLPFSLALASRTSRVCSSVQACRKSVLAISISTSRRLGDPMIRARRPAAQVSRRSRVRRSTHRRRIG